MSNHEEIVYYLTDGYWEQSDHTRRTFDIQTGGTLTVNVTALTEWGQGFAFIALDAWSKVSGINFELVEHDDAHIMFDDITPDDGIPSAYSVSSVTGGTIIQSRVNISIGWPAPGHEEPSYIIQTYIHEVGHALGLGHAGPYNFDAPDNYFTDTISYYDSWQASAMSYIDQAENFLIHGDKAYLITPMIADIEAIHELYGTPDNVNGGDTRYGVNANTGGVLDLVFELWMEGTQPGGVPLSFTIYDTGGIDWLDFRTDRADEVINLDPESASDIYGIEGNLIIAYSTLR